MGQNNLVKIVIIALILAAFVLLGWSMITGKSGKNPAVQNNSSGQTNKNDPAVPLVVKLEDDTLPLALSKEVPHYEETLKLEAFSVKYPGSSKEQNIYRFYTSKSPEESFSFYNDWAGKNGWTITDTVKENNYYALLLSSKAGDSMWIKINNESGGKVKIGLEMF